MLSCSEQFVRSHHHISGNMVQGMPGTMERSRGKIAQNEREIHLYLSTNVKRETFAMRFFVSCYGTTQFCLEKPQEVEISIGFVCCQGRHDKQCRTLCRRREGLASMPISFKGLATIILIPTYRYTAKCQHYSHIGATNAQSYKKWMPFDAVCAGEE